ncbi:cell fate (sporulation/competence/biofilm development) regulator YlbF (YheA/YmcA/DUF963 family) [Croceifilum oryzae]|uniref:Cell fate (Sporulation/competence/biofilm development) regulator YlbF (YheA/YmcA/DUF963 family) n=1 Tax=Croceifilum oryzae TaxID=1553429 RepID=A0AAJ1WT78_9BACL|nr:YlbF family regulator [Croceifilum oryzae]MDQ0416726.1 cell fate (sporulation/competence/biofilm development) regulator YlbF (YheA/YmcA/DUF963 family) [Croceifilum oryzae]
MENPYDFAYGMVNAIRESDVYLELKKLKSELETNESYKEMLKGYHQLHITMQKIRMQGIEPTDEFKEGAEKITLAIQEVPVIMQYLQAEERFGATMKDLQTIMLAPVQEIMDFS